MSEKAKLFKVRDGNEDVTTHWEGVEGNKPLIEIALEHMIMKGCEGCDESGIDEKALRYMYMLRRHYRIVITSTRSKDQRNNVMGWLLSYKVPFDELRLGMPDAVFKLGPRNVEHRGWAETLRRVAVREEGGLFGQCPECGSMLVGTYTSKQKKQIRYCRDCDWEEGRNEGNIRKKEKDAEGDRRFKGKGRGTGKNKAAEKKKRQRNNGSVIGEGSSVSDNEGGDGRE